MKTTKYILVTITILTLISCAQITAPTGGEKDVIAPKLNQEKTFPKNYSTNFEGNKITLTFDEYFVLKNPQSNVFFSPILEENPEFLVKGKTLIIDIKNKLKENTTYTINFGDAVSDYTAGNKIPDFKYVFSTGNYIDSMQFNGSIKDAFTQKTEEDILVLLYDSFDDSVVTNTIPTYFAKTDKEGNYSFSYVKEGKYKIFALKDENRNYKYDLPNEKTGFLDNLIELKDTQKIAPVDFNVFEKKYKKQQISSKKYTFPGKLTLIFEKHTKSVEVKNLDGTEFKYDKREISKNGDTLVFWKTDEKLDKTNLIVKTDGFTDTIKIYKYKIPRKDTGLKLTFGSNQIDENKGFIIQTNRPIKRFDSSRFKISIDSTLLKIDSVNSKNKFLELNFQSKENNRIRYEILPNAIIDIFGLTNLDTIVGFINVREKDYYGTFILDFKPKNDSATYLVQLLSESGKTLREKVISRSQKISFTKLKPQKYSVRVILDKNKNGKWDTGDYYKNLQPEPIYYYQTQIEIRSNWEMEEEFIF